MEHGAWSKKSWSTRTATHVYGMEPPDDQRGAVLRVSLETEPVPAIDHVVAAALGAHAVRHAPVTAPVPAPVSVSVSVHAPVSLPAPVPLPLFVGPVGRARQPGGAAARAPRREGVDADRQEAGLGVWRGHAVEAERGRRLGEPLGEAAAVWADAGAGAGTDAGSLAAADKKEAECGQGDTGGSFAPGLWLRLY